MIVEDNAVSAMLLKECAEGEGLEVAGLFESGEDLLAALKTVPQPDLVLLDLGLPGISGIETARLLKDCFPGVEILVQTVFEDPESILGAIRAGVSGYLVKSEACQDLGRAVAEVLAGGSSLSPRVARRVVEEFQAPPSPTQNTLHHTPRGQEILDHLVQGYACKIIGDRLGISTFTVNNHLRKVYEKMRVGSRAEAVAVVVGAKNQRVF
jgi:DNA-binding NarL/FixJ family response regulator